MVAEGAAAVNEELVRNIVHYSIFGDSNALANAIEVTLEAGGHKVGEALRGPLLADEVLGLESLKKDKFSINDL